MERGQRETKRKKKLLPLPLPLPSYPFPYSSPLEVARVRGPGLGLELRALGFGVVREPRLGGGPGRGFAGGVLELPAGERRGLGSSGEIDGRGSSGIGCCLVRHSRFFFFRPFQARRAWCDVFRCEEKESSKSQRERGATVGCECLESMEHKERETKNNSEASCSSHFALPPSNREPLSAPCFSLFVSPQTRSQMLSSAPESLS